MTESPITANRGQELLHEAARVLTSAARLEDGPDFAEFVTLAVAAAAANVGGVEELLSRRSGSWEASYVRDMLRSTVGEGPATLLAHRTEPITLAVDVEGILIDLGYWTLFMEAEQELQRREAAIGVPTITNRYNDPDAELQVGQDHRGVPTVSGHPDHPGFAEAVAALPAATPEQEQAQEAIDDLLTRLGELWEADKATYGEAFKANLTAAAALYPNLPVPVEVTAHLDLQHTTNPGTGLEWALFEQARAGTPLPSSGIPLKDYPITADLAAVERAAGRDPLARLEQS